MTSVLLTIALVDLALLLWHGPVRTAERFYVDDAKLGYRMRPDFEFVFASAYHGYRATVRTNSRGLRDDEVIVPKPRDVFRVLLLGDSMVAGLEVERERTMEALCERLLTRHGKVEVINGGVRGYNLDNVLAFLETEGVRYEPDLVVYVFVENDLTASPVFEPLTGGLAEQQLMVIGRQNPRGGESMGGIVGRLACYSHLTFRLELLRQMIVLRRQRDREDSKNPRVPGGLFVLLRSSDYEGAAHYRFTGERIARLAQLCRDHGSQFLLAGAPHREEIESAAQAWWSRQLATPDRPLDFDGIERFLSWVAAQNGLLLLDPVPAFREAQAREGGTFWFHKDGHLNERGHRLFAQLLASEIERTPAFLDWCSPMNRGAPAQPSETGRNPD